MRRTAPAALLLAASFLVAGACSAPNLGGQLFTCSSDSDCSSGFVCGSVAGGRACVPQGSIVDASVEATAEAGVDGPSEGAVDGPVNTSPITVGMTAAFSGVSGDLGTQLRRGILAWFNTKNASGGVAGRPLQLDSRDDQYEPGPALTNTYALLDIATPNPGDLGPDGGSASYQQALAAPRDVMGSHHVMAMLGDVGTPQMLVTAPVCVRDKVIYFAPYTGALSIIRDGTVDSPYIFNYRASYYDETAGMVAYLTTQATPRVTDHKHLIAFTQQDSYGNTGYAGFQTAWNTSVEPIGATDIFRASYTRNQPSTVAAAVTSATDYLQQLASQAAAAPAAGVGSVGVGILLVPTYDPAAQFVKGVTDWQNETGQSPTHPERRLLDITYMSVSFVGADALVQDLVALGKYQDLTTGASTTYGDGVWVTEVVPYYGAQSSGVLAYRTALKTVDPNAASWGSLEGYLSAQLFTDGLDHATAFDSDSLVKAYESLGQLDLGIGTNVGFSSSLPGGHQASKTVWLSRIKFDGANPQGGFDVPYVYGPGANGTTIQPNSG